MNSDHVEVIKSNKGHYKIIHQGFMYTKHKSFNNVTRWRCAARGSCRGSIMTSNDFTKPSPKMAHTHPADYKACEMAKARYLIPKVKNFVFKKEHFGTSKIETETNKANSIKMNIILDPKQFRIEKTTRGAPCLIFENYKFRYGNKMKDEIRWRCTNKLCKATIKTNEKGITEKRTVHDHEPVCERKSTKKSSRISSSRIKTESVPYYRPHGHFADCSDSFDNTEPNFIPPTVESTSINRNGSSIGVRYIKSEYQSDIDEVMVGNETQSHFMDLLCKCI